MCLRTKNVRKRSAMVTKLFHRLAPKATLRVPLATDTKFIDYQNAHIILIGAREGRDVIKSEISMDIQESRVRKYIQ